MNLKQIKYFWKIKTNQLQALDSSRKLKTWKINKNQRTGLEFWGYKFKSSKLENSFVRKALQDMNSVRGLLRKNENEKSSKNKCSKMVFEEFKRDPCMQLSDCLSWKHVRFRTNFSWDPT